MNHDQIMISNFSASIRGSGSYSVAEGVFFIFVFINGQFSSSKSHHKLTREPLTDERLCFDLWDFSLLWRRRLGLPVFDLAQPELKKSANPYTSLREKKRMRVMSGGTEEKEITCGSNSDPPPPPSKHKSPGFTVHPLRCGSISA